MPKQERVILLRQAASLGARRARIGKLGINMNSLPLTGGLIQILGVSEAFPL